jgi:hypothetical protein
MTSRFDPGKDAVNQIRHGFSLGFGDRIFADEDHVIIPELAPVVCTDFRER